MYSKMMRFTTTQTDNGFKFYVDDRPVALIDLENSTLSCLLPGTSIEGEIHPLVDEFAFPEMEEIDASDFCDHLLSVNVDGHTLVQVNVDKNTVEFFELRAETPEDPASFDPDLDIYEVSLAEVTL